MARVNPAALGWLLSPLFQGPPVTGKEARADALRIGSSTVSTACDVCRAPAISPRLPDTVRVLGFVLILLVAGNVAAQTDRETLMAVYDATDGPNWHQDTNWGSGRPLGEWHGVTTDQSGRVTQLTLQRNALTGPIPAELGALARLQHISLWGASCERRVRPSFCLRRRGERGSADGT